MGDLSRTGISLEHDLLAGFDKLIARRGYKNRSEAMGGKAVLKEQAIQ